MLHAVGHDRLRLVAAMAVTMWVTLPMAIEAQTSCNPMHRCRGESSAQARQRCAETPHDNACPPAPPPPPPPTPVSIEAPPVGVGTDCPTGTFWEPDELPDVHQLNFVGSQSQFEGMCSHQMDYSRVVTGDLTFNDAQYAGVELQVHGGVYQRRGVTKPSFRLKWSSEDPFGDKHGNPFSYPRTGCNNMKKMTLRGEWNDYPMANQGIMIRNKITQDLIKKAGGQTPRVEFAVLNVNGNYFGFYALEEHTSEGFIECQGWDVGATSLYKQSSPTQGTKWMRTGLSALEGFERKMMGPHDCSGCDNDHPARQRAGDGCGCPPSNEDLDPLFTVLNDRQVTLEELTSVFNVTDYLVWQMVTTYSMNVDTGAHNSYIHGPTAGVAQTDSNRLWRVINIDADWGWGQGWCCRNSIDLPGVGSRRGCSPQDSRLTSMYCCGEMKFKSILENSFGGVLYGRYLNMFYRFLQEDYTQECTIQSAVDQLLGPEGVLTEYLQNDVDYWSTHHHMIDSCGHLCTWHLANEVTFIKAWMGARVQYLKGNGQLVRSNQGGGRVADQCVSTPSCMEIASAIPLTCRDRGLGPSEDPETNLAALCTSAGQGESAGEQPPHICSHDGMDPNCVHNPDPCAMPNACLNGGECQTEALPISATADACGCRVGWGWGGSDHRCEEGKTTSRREAIGCVMRAGDNSRLAFSCDCRGGFTGETCENSRDGPDGCGCEPGAGWSRDEASCVDGGHTSSSEEAECQRTTNDLCGCPPGEGWSSSAAECVAGGRTSDSEASACQNSGGGEGGSTCIGDVNGDGRVNVADLLLTLGAFGANACDGSSSAEAVAAADMNADCQVNVEDLLLNLGVFGQTCEDAGRRL